jgi:hypothetical protein
VGYLEFGGSGRVDGEYQTARGFRGAKYSVTLSFDSFYVQGNQIM